MTGEPLTLAQRLEALAGYIDEIPPPLTLREEGDRQIYREAATILDANAAEIASLREQVAALTAERDSAVSGMKYVRAVWKKRAEAAEAECERLRTVLGDFVDHDLSYHGGNIVIPTACHSNAISLVSRARAALANQEPSK